MIHRIIITITISKAPLELAVKLKGQVDRLLEKLEGASATLTAIPQQGTNED